MGCDELVVEDRPEGRRDLLAGALDVGGDERGLRDDLVLEARVELHVPRLVDLLGRQERHLLLAAVRARPGRRTCVVIRSSATISEPRTKDTSERSSIAAHCSRSTGQIDVPRAPLALLPVAVERLRVVQVELVRVGAHAGATAGLRARMIAEAACGARGGSRVSRHLVRPASASACVELCAGERPGDAAGPLLHVGAGRVVHVLVGDHVGDGEASAGPQDPRDLAQHLGLVAGEVDHAVGDHDVDARVRERDLLDVALVELDVLDAGLLRVLAGERRASRRSCPGRCALPVGPTRSRGEQNVDARRRSRGRGPSRPRAVRRRRSGCRSRVRRASAVSGSCSWSPSA